MTERKPQRRRELAVPLVVQPDDVTCGPTCLYSVLRFFGDETPFERLLEVTPRNPDGGTMAVYLALAALRLGYGARIHSYNYRIVDPSWARLAPAEVQARLVRRAEAVRKPKLQAACRAYAEFLASGGELRFDDLTAPLLVESLDQGRPILCGLSATYLYGLPRERPDDNVEDDVAGDPVGHFLVICGYEDDQFLVRDPATGTPEAMTGSYQVKDARLINAILLGIVSYDAVLLEIWPKEGR